MNVASVFVSPAAEADRYLPEGPNAVTVAGRPAVAWVNIQTAPDATSGAVLRTVGVGTYPAALAVDERAGRAFVVNAGGTTVRASQGWWEQAVRWLQPARLPWLPRPAPASLVHSTTGSVSVLDASDR